MRGGVFMKRCVNELNKFRMNHVGFTKNAAKKFVYLGNEAEEFFVRKISDGKILPYAKGTFSKMKESCDFDACLVGDVSFIKEDGLYLIECGNDNSRIFSVCDNIYDTVCRTLTQYYIWQRCGDDCGWNGKNCHRGEQLVDKRGKRHCFSGGHHQSGDLRKWTFGAAHGVYCLSEYKRNVAPLWDKGEIFFDISHSVKYYLSLISDEGYVFDSSFVPFDYDKEKCEAIGMNDYTAFWKPFRYYDKPAPVLGQFSVIRLLASASLTLEKYDKELAEKAKLGAQKIWDYMMSEGMKLHSHEWTEYPPLGHFSFKQVLFDYYFEDSAMTLAVAAHAAASMYKMSHDENISLLAGEILEKLIDLAVYKDEKLHHFAICKNDDRAAEESSYFSANIPFSIAECIETFPDHKDIEKWKQCAIECVERYEKMSSANCYGKTTTQLTSNENGQLAWSHCSPSYNSDLARSAAFLVKMSKFCHKEKCLEIAQRLLDWLVGANPYDSSSIECVGFNQVRRADFGEFFPGTPQIPGAVVTEIHPNAFGTPFGCEYDMPVVGDVLLAFSLYANAVNDQLN